VLASGEPRFDGSVLAELARLVETGVIRVLDIMVLIMGEDGKAYGLDIEDLSPEDKSTLGFINTDTRGLFDAEDAATFTEGMVPGSAIVALAIESAWAVPLMNAIAGAGAEIALHTRIPGIVFDDAMAALGVDE
jgi:hypothetical protein